MAILRLDATPNNDRSHAVAKAPALGVAVDVLFGDAHTADETVIWNSLTWTAKASGATGRQYNVGVSATLTAAAFAAAVTAHADGDDYEVTSDGATVTIRRRSQTGAIGLVTGTAATTASNYRSEAVPLSGAVASVLIDDSKSKIEVMDALKALLRGVSRQFGKVTAVADVATTGTTVE